VFGGAHYSVVGAGGFFAGLISDHFRRHYTQMSLVARLELAALLVVSSRLTRAVRRRDEKGAGIDRTRQEFETEVLDIQDQFLTFVHRFRFTGVSSQVQAQEMYTLWRQSLGLSASFAEVKDELDAAVTAIRARQTEREMLATTNLTKVAAIGGVLALYLAALSVQRALAPILGCDEWQGGWRDLVLIALVVLAGTGTLAGGLAMLSRWPGRLWRASLVVGLAALLGLILIAQADPDGLSGSDKGQCVESSSENGQ
jgi:hypothetical protein